MGDIKYGTPPALVTLLSATGATLANNTNLAAGTYDNSASGTFYVMADFELLLTFGSAPSDGTQVRLWMATSNDGTNYADGSATVTPNYAPICSFPVRNVTTAQRIQAIGCMIMPKKLQFTLRNDGTGQTISTGMVLTMLPYGYNAA